MVNRKSIRSALQAWKRSETLGEHPLAELRIVAERRVAAGYADTPIGRGVALRDILREAIEALRPATRQPDYTDDRWRPYLILTDQYIEGQSPGSVAERLSIAQSTYNHAQAEALDSVAAILREQEHQVTLDGHERQTVAVAMGNQPVAELNGRDGSGPIPERPSADESLLPGQPQDITKVEPPEVRRKRAIAPVLMWTLAALAIGLVVLLWLVFRRPAPSPRAVTAIPFGEDRTSFIGANLATQRVYVGLEDQRAIAVIDASTNAVVARIPTQGYHKGIAVNPATNRIYVAQQFAGSVRVIDGANNQVLADLTVPDLVQTVGDVAVNPATNRLYVIRANNNDVAVFDATTNAFLDAVAFGQPSAPGCPVVACDSNQIAVNPATNLVYVTNPASHRVTVIDGASNKVITTVPVGKAPNGIAVNPATNSIYVTNNGERSVSVIDGTSHRVRATIPVQPGPAGIAVNPATNRVYVNDGDGKSVSVVDGAANLVVATIPLDAPSNFSAVLPSSGRIYVTTDSHHDVKVIEDVAQSFAAWTPLEPTGGPPTPRGDAAGRPLGYDPASNRLMFFGGMKQGGPLLNDTWVLADADGTTGTPYWIQLATVNTPPPRRSHAGAYDAASNRLITYGGCLGGCKPMDNNVYVLSNANGLGGTPTWEELQPTGGPPPERDGHSAVYDPSSNRLIVFGGDNCCGQRYNDVWVLTHANGLGGTPEWIQLVPQGTPPPGRVTHSAVYDVANNRMIVFGGSGSDGVLNDVWVLSGANGANGTPTWAPLSVRGEVPAARNGHAAVYDQATGHMLIFGGSIADGLRNDTWLLSHANGLGDAAAWQQLTPSGAPPSPRIAANAIYRPATNRLVLVNGDTQAGSLNDTWTLINAFPPEH